MDKPLHKDLSFWIVAVVALGFANVAQLSIALPWFKAKVVAMRPAPRSPAATGQAMNGAGVFGVEATPELDFSRKTYTWQRPRPDQLSFENLPEQVVIIPTEYSPPSGGWATSRSNTAIGIRMPAEFLVRAAYQWSSRSRMILPDPMPAGQYDYLAHLPTGTFEALQMAVERKLGLVAKRETRPMDVWLLKLDHEGAPGLQSAETPAGPPAGAPGTIVFRTLPNFVNFLESILTRPVIDETGLTGDYNIRFSTSILRSLSPGRPATDGAQTYNAVLKEQFGLKLVETNCPVEVLVVQRVNGAPEP